MLGIGRRLQENDYNDEEFFLGGKAAQEKQARKARENELRKRRKKLKEVDADEYEDEIWLAYVEPQYENEYSKMIAAQRSRTAASYLSKKAEA